MVSREFLGPTNLSEAQTLCIHKMTKVFMICEDENLMHHGSHIVFPLESFSQKKRYT